MKHMCLRGLAALVLFAAVPATASQPQVVSVEGYKDLSGGEMFGATLDADGVARRGPRIEAWADALPGPVLALAADDDGTLYAATSGPARVFKIARGQEPTLICEAKAAAASALLIDKANLYVLTAPKAGLSVCKKNPTGKTPAPTLDIEVKHARFLLDAVLVDGSIYAVGGGEVGVFLKIDISKKTVEKLATTDEKTLRSVAVHPRTGMFVVGGGDLGRVYRYAANRLVAVYDSDADEVADLVIDRAGTVFAAILDGEGKLKDRVTSEKNADKEEDSPQPRKKPKKVKGAELVAIDASDNAVTLWQSKRSGAYALRLHKGRLLLGTGPYGRIYSLATAEGERAQIVGHVPDGDEVMAFAVVKGQVVLGTAHGGAVAALSSQSAPQGEVLSPVIDADARARWGHVDVPGVKRIEVRTGYTDEPDDSWSPFLRVGDDGKSRAPPGRYAQIRATLSGGEAVTSMRISHLVDNQPPIIERIDVVAPHWKVTRNPREKSSNRSVTFSENPFKKFLGVKGTIYPTLSERPSGKQTPEWGYRTVYAWVEDGDKDELRYRFFLRRAPSTNFEMVQDWSDNPFVSLDGTTYGPGRYQVKVEVDDLLTNGPERVRADQAVSSTFVVSLTRPAFSSAQLSDEKGGARVRFSVKAQEPLAGVRCAAAGGEWMPLDPVDGILDGPEERFDVVLPVGDARHVSCEAMDESLNADRIDLSR